jgi:gamma-glutamylcyclotransferase (GGCT)/AIG2-like uncharacterized protein YtfP
MSDQCLFVYGTLRRNAGHEMFQWLARGSEFVGEATFQGKLYIIRDYPGVVPSHVASDVVHGEMYRLRDPDSLLARLDRYEGCGPSSPEPAQYNRETREVRLLGRETIAAWIYLYARTVEDLELVRSGDFLATRHGQADVGQGSP